jgi:hypothetical protein
MAMAKRSQNGDIEQTLAVLSVRSGQQLDAEAQQLVRSYQALESCREFAALYWVAEP